jgi:Na+/glutamate symporter
MPYIEAKTPVGKTIMSIFFTGMALVGLIAGLDAGGGAWAIFLVFSVLAILAWRNTLAHQRYLEEQARQARR